MNVCLDVVKLVKITKESCEKMEKRGNENSKRTDASLDLFGVSLVQVINLDHPLVRLSFEFGWNGPRGNTPSLRGFVKGGAR